MDLEKIRKNELVGFVFYLLIIVAGYTFIIKFVQLGLPDFIVNYLELKKNAIILFMFYLAVLTSICCLVFGYSLDKLKWDLETKLKIFFICLVLQTPLILLLFSFNTILLFFLWINLISIIMGLQTPISISFIRDFIRPKYRGLFAGIATALIYSYGILSPFPWNISGFINELFFGLILGIPTIMIFIGLRLFRNKEKQEIFNAKGNFVNYNKTLIIMALIGVIFVDSLGFLRIIETPHIYANVWRGNFDIKILLVSSHTGFALLSGFLYSKGKPYLILLISLFMITMVDLFFAFLHNLIFLSKVLGIFYCGAVSMYTINLLALWGDISTPESIGKFAGIGIGICGWLMTFISTAFSFIFIESLDFSTHLVISALISLSFLLFTILIKIQHKAIKE